MHKAADQSASPRPKPPSTSETVGGLKNRDRFGFWTLLSFHFPFAWSSGGCHGGFEAEAGECALRPCGVAKGLAAGDGAMQGFEICIRVGAIDTGKPIARAIDGTVVQAGAGLGGAVAALPQAGPSPLLGAFDEVGAQSVAFDVSTDREVVLVALDGEGLVAPLVNVTRADELAMLLPPSDVGDAQALHESGEIAVVSWPEDHMPVSRHEAIGADPHRSAVQGLLQDQFEREVVRFFLE